jgi:5-methylcytosine-specific restriction endonuclease McrA
MAVRPCIERGCPNYTSATRCPQHQREWDQRKRQDPTLTGGHARDNSAVWKRIRLEVIARDRLRCQDCNISAPIGGLIVHHIVEKSQGGTDRLDNLVTLCGNCHLLRHAA